MHIVGSREFSQGDDLNHMHTMVRRQVKVNRHVKLTSVSLCSFMLFSLSSPLTCLPAESRLVTTISGTFVWLLSGAAKLIEIRRNKR